MPYRGVEGVRQWIADIDDQFDVWEGRLDEIRAPREDRFVIFYSIHARGRGSRVELDWPAALLTDFRAARLLRITIYNNRGEALKAAGLEK